MLNSKTIEDGFHLCESKFSSTKPNSVQLMINFHQSYSYFQEQMVQITDMCTDFWKEALEENPSIA